MRKTFVTLIMMAALSLPVCLFGQTQKVEKTKKADKAKYEIPAKPEKPAKGGNKIETPVTPVPPGQVGKEQHNEQQQGYEKTGENGMKEGWSKNMTAKEIKKAEKKRAKEMRRAEKMHKKEQKKMEKERAKAERTRNKADLEREKVKEENKEYRIK